MFPSEGWVMFPLEGWGMLPLEGWVRLPLEGWVRLPLALLQLSLQHLAHPPWVDHRLQGISLRTGGMVVVLPLPPGVVEGIVLDQWPTEDNERLRI